MHRNSLLLSCAFAAAHAASVATRLRSSSRVRIINGTVVSAPASEYSFFALPTRSAYSNIWLGCGASIVSPTFGLSAAHCFGGGKAPCSVSARIALWLGDVSLQGGRVVPKPGGRSFRVEADRICHPQFDGVCAHGHDVALLKLASALPAWVSPAKLDLSGASCGKGDTLTAIGFGLTESDSDPALIAGVSSRLRQVSLIALGDTSHACSTEFSGGWGCSDEFSEGPARNLDQQLCAGSSAEPPRDTCSGDSGSPLLGSSGAQVGIVSYGGGPGEALRGPGRICGDPEFPGIYTRLSGLASFIESHVTDVVIA